MRKIADVEIQEYHYDSLEERNTHVHTMEEEGWEADSTLRKLPLGSNIVTATDKDYKWYARFVREKVFA